ncbi:unnamed protein product, partial [Didymodactylos carnosus]
HALYVSSLDGKLTAIDANNYGRVLWTIDTGSALVDSSLSKLEILRDAISVRLIPSLSGGLYERYPDGHVEPLPFSADSLLSASFRLDDDSVIVGGKHIETLGLNVHTGRILYMTSSLHGSTHYENKTETLDNEYSSYDPLLVIRRTTQTVRAVSVRSGHEKWNFSVSNNELLSIKSHDAKLEKPIRNEPSRMLHNRLNENIPQIESDSVFQGYFKYQLQTGVINAYHHHNNELVWSKILNVPIAAVWEMKNGQLYQNDLFNVEHEDERHSNDNRENQAYDMNRRSAFVGEFNSTPYVLVSPHLQNELIHLAMRNKINTHRGPRLLPWRKENEKRTVLDMSNDKHPRSDLSTWVRHNNNDNDLSTYDGQHNWKYALALRQEKQQRGDQDLPQEESCDNAGYFTLLQKDSEQKPPTNVLSFLFHNGRDDDDDYQNDRHKWTKTISISTAVIAVIIIILTFVVRDRHSIWNKYFRRSPSTNTATEDQTSETIVNHSTENNQVTSTILLQTTSPPSNMAATSEENQDKDTFRSRYSLEFEHVRFLGKGGFGIVFEAINKLDERKVAIKRVALKKENGKERAQKEIRCLAVLNHPNIIQYYYAWNETAPISWQDEEDKRLMAKNQTTRGSVSFPTGGIQSTMDSDNIQSFSFKMPNLVEVNGTNDNDNTQNLLERSNPLRLHEEFSLNNSFSNAIQNSNDDHVFTSEDEHEVHVEKPDANNNTNRHHRDRRTTKSWSSKSSHSILSTPSSSVSYSPVFDHTDHSLSSSTSSASLSIDDNHNTNKENDTDGFEFESSSALDIDKKKKNKTDLSKSSIVTSEKSVEEHAVVSINTAPSTHTYFYFVMELCKPESLRDCLLKHKIDRQHALNIFYQIIKGIEYIHEQKLIHRDLKPSNILFSMDDTVKIGDFGLVSAFGDDKHGTNKKKGRNSIRIETISTGNDEVGGTMLYMSPEQINREQYNQKVDIYAMGIILFELLYPFSTQMERIQAITNLRSQKPKFPDEFENTKKNKSLCCLTRWLLSYSPRERPKASELRNNKLFQKILQIEASDSLHDLDSTAYNELLGTKRDRMSSLRRSFSSSSLSLSMRTDSETNSQMTPTTTKSVSSLTHRQHRSAIYTNEYQTTPTIRVHHADEISIGADTVN